MANEHPVEEVDVLIVGAGPAGLSCAIHLQQLIEQHNAAVKEKKKDGEKLEPVIAVIEKAKNVSNHQLSGAVLDPRALFELFPDAKERGAPLECPVKEDAMMLLTKTGKITFPLVSVLAPPLNNHGNYIISLDRLTAWLGKQLEALGQDVFHEFPGRELLFDENKVIGVRTGDKGINKEGKKKGNYEPGTDLQARVTVLAEGPRGNMTKQLIPRLKLDEGRNPQNYATGVKELWRVKPEKHIEGRVWHTLGYPLDSHTFGGAWIYHYVENLVSIGVVTGLDYANPYEDPHENLQKYKLHPILSDLLEGGELVGYGAKTITEGGYWAMPKNHGDGFLMIGENAGLVNAMRLKGIHLAIKSGMLAAETIFEGLLADDFSEKQMARFQEKLDQSWIKKEMYGVRNFHQAFKWGTLPAMMAAGLQTVTNGNMILTGRLAGHVDHTSMKTLKAAFGDNVQPKEYLKFDGKLTFNKVSDVYLSGTQHDEDQPAHLLIADYDICRTKCTTEYGNPCEKFCPAAVYEIVEDGAGKRPHLNFANCVHCKTCDIKDPYGIITWVTPEGGGGPKYKDL